MDVFLMVRRKKTTMFIDAKESTTVLELKKMIRGIMKIPVADMKLHNEGSVIEDHQTLGDAGFTSSNAKVQAPATVGLAYRQEDGTFEPLEITDLSTPEPISSLQHD